MAPEGRMEKKYFGETPEMVFTKEHKELVIESGKWIESIANTYSFISTLIITSTLAATIQVPGGNSEQNKGVPNFFGKEAFILFEASIVISMVSSSLSLLMFLCLLTVRKMETDFLIRIPLTLVMGFLSLFVSATFGMLEFGAALSLIFASKHPWIVVFISPLIGLPIWITYNFYYMLTWEFMRSAFQMWMIYGVRSLKLLGRIYI